MFLFIAIAQTIPLFAVAYATRRARALNVTTIVMFIFSAAIGASAFFVVDAVILAIAYGLCVPLVSKTRRRGSVITEIPSQEVSIIDNFPHLNEDERVALASIEFTAKNTSKKQKVSQADAEYMAICYLLDSIQKDGHGKKGTQVITNAVKEAYPQHLDDMSKYLNWRDGNIELDSDSIRALLARLKRIPPVGSS